MQSRIRKRIPFMVNAELDLFEELTYAFRHMTGSKWKRCVKLFRTPGIKAVIVHRFAHWLLSQHITVRMLLLPLKAWYQYRIAWKWGIEIGEQAIIGKGFRIAHFGGIFIGDGVRAGANLIISHDVTLGASGQGDNRGAPTLGNNVYVAPGVKIVGPITIGNYVKIGPNAVVDRDIPDGALVQTRAPQIVIFPSFLTTKAEEWPFGSINTQDDTR